MHETARVHTHRQRRCHRVIVFLLNNTTISLRRLVFSKLIQWSI